MKRFIITAAFVVVGLGCGREPARPHDPATAHGPNAILPAPTRNASEPARQLPPQVQSSADPPHREPAAEPVYRPDDDRPRHNDTELERRGIHRYESRRLVLYTDIAAELAEPLPLLVDALYDEWVSYFGDLPPARDGADFQMTGYLMAESEPFVAAGLLPVDLPPFHHGRHRGQQFWLRDQPHDYYRAHLLLHEATHCFMTLLPGTTGPVWYMEGMAEHFASHRTIGEGQLLFRQMPTSPEEFAGMGRITLVRQEIAAGQFKSLEEVFAFRAEEFLDNSHYAWAWAACYFFDRHPAYRERFRELGNPRLRQQFGEEFRQRFAVDAHALAIEWAHFVHTLRYGYDLERAAIEFTSGESFTQDPVVEVSITSDRGWQSAGVRVKAGQRYEITAEGRFTLADEPKPWISDAGGISFDYFEGRPLGRLLAAVLADDCDTVDDPACGLRAPIDIGRGTTFTAPQNGTLYFRLNDGWDRLHDNHGVVVVRMRASE